MTKQYKIRNNGHNKNLNKVVCESLQEALILLMNEMNFADITITELCKRAGVSRMAFYNNYRSKEEVLKEKISEQSEKLLNKIGSPFRQKTDILWYEKLFEFTKEEVFILNTIFKSSFKFDYLTHVNNIVLHDPTISSSQLYLRLMWAGGIVNTIINWIETGMKEDTKELASFCYKNLSVWIN